MNQKFTIIAGDDGVCIGVHCACPNMGDLPFNPKMEPDSHVSA